MKALLFAVYNLILADKTTFSGFGIGFLINLGSTNTQLRSHCTTSSANAQRCRRLPDSRLSAILPEKFVSNQQVCSILPKSGELWGRPQLQCPVFWFWRGCKTNPNLLPESFRFFKSRHEQIFDERSFGYPDQTVQWQPANGWRLE